MTAIDGYVEKAKQLLDSGVPGLSAQAAIYVQLAQLVALENIALRLGWSPEIARAPLPNPQPHSRFPLHDAAEILESYAVGDEGEARERTIARLVLHPNRPFADAGLIAKEALANAGRRETWRADEVRQAARTLGIIP